MTVPDLSNFSFCLASRLLEKAISFGFSAFKAASRASRKAWLKARRASNDDRSGLLAQKAAFESSSDFLRASCNS